MNPKTANNRGNELFLSLYRLPSLANSISLRSILFSILEKSYGGVHSCNYIENQEEYDKTIVPKLPKQCIPIKQNDNFIIAEMPKCDYLVLKSLKHFALEYEKERRIIISNPKEIKFFEKDGLIKPYTEVKIPVTALKQIWLAPGCDEELSRKSILMLLKSKDVTHITENDIIHSKHPYIDR